MNYHHQHNLVEPGKAGIEKKYGIRISLPAGDTFQRLLGEDWLRVRWYATEAERDRAYDDIAGRHLFSRQTDTPTQVLEKIIR